MWRLERAGELDERAHAVTGATFCNLGVVARRACGARDIEMCPWAAAGELLEEQTRSQRSAATTRRNVAQVGDFGVEVTAVVLRQREVPHAFAGALGRVFYLRDPIVVRTHQPCDLVAE